MEGIPALGFAAFSGTGKTTLIAKIVPQLKADGLRLAVLKHSEHCPELDSQGKDSWRFTQAGADISVVSSPARTVLVEQRELSLLQVSAFVHDVDLILVEGYKLEPITQIGVCRSAARKDFPAALERYVAVVTDLELGKIRIPCFALDDVRGISSFILENMASFSRL